MFASALYSHFETPALRDAFRAEAARVASELVVVEQAWHDGLPAAACETRVLADGSRWPVFKRYFTPDGLRAELGGEVLMATPSFVVVRVTGPRRR